MVMSVTGKSMDGPMGAWLHDGIVLCELANRLSPGSVKRVNKGSMPFKQMENIPAFLKVARALGCQEHTVFETVDLHAQKDLRLVVRCLLALRRITEDLGVEPPRAPAPAPAPAAAPPPPVAPAPALAPTPAPPPAAPTSTALSASRTSGARRARSRGRAARRTATRTGRRSSGSGGGYGRRARRQKQAKYSNEDEAAAAEAVALAAGRRSLRRVAQGRARAVRARERDPAGQRAAREREQDAVQADGEHQGVPHGARASSARTTRSLRPSTSSS